MAKKEGTSKKAATIKKTEKTVSKTVAPKAEKKTEAVKKVPAAKKTEKVASTITASTETVVERKAGDVKIDVVSPEGTVSGSMQLPKEIFAAPINKQLMTQAIRVYLANQREGSASTKTRGEVEGSTRKLYKQKGTGRARHGAIRASIYVGGGVALGPKPRDYRLDFPKKMKKVALASAFTSQLITNSIKVVSDVSKLELKTKAFATMFTKLSCTRSTLMLLANDELQTIRAMRNIPNVDVLSVRNVFTYSVLRHKHIVITKSAVAELEKQFEKEV